LKKLVPVTISSLWTEVLLGGNSPFTQREEDVLSIGLHSIAHFSISAMAISYSAIWHAMLDAAITMQF
jgi:hypothetical protein